MGKVLSLMVRPIKTYNIESRAHKIISMKPKLAPKYESNTRELEMVLRDNPHIVEEYANKNEELDKRLKDIYVSSADPDATDTPLEGSKPRPLPLNRDTPLHNNFGVEFPETPEPGFITIKQVFSLLAEHKRNKSLDVHITALKYKLPKETVENIIEYYGSYDVIEPKTGKKEFDPQVLYQKIEAGVDLKKLRT